MSLLDIFQHFFNNVQEFEQQEEFNQHVLNQLIQLNDIDLATFQLLQIMGRLSPRQQMILRSFLDSAADTASDRNEKSFIRRLATHAQAIARERHLMHNDYESRPDDDWLDDPNS